MMAFVWEKLKKFVNNRDMTRCPYCGGVITQNDDPAGLAYSKTKGGSHVFIHEQCMNPKGVKGAK